MIFCPAVVGLKAGIVNIQFVTGAVMVGTICIKIAGHIIVKIETGGIVANTNTLFPGEGAISGIKVTSAGAGKNPGRITLFQCQAGLAV